MVFRMFFIGWTNIMGIQILIPHNKNREFMLSTTIPAIFSVGLNILLIPPLGYIGASIVSVATEGLVWVIQLYFTRSYLKEVKILPSMLKIFLAALFDVWRLVFCTSFYQFLIRCECLDLCCAWLLCVWWLSFSLMCLGFSRTKKCFKEIRRFYVRLFDCRCWLVRCDLCLRS